MTQPMTATTEATSDVPLRSWLPAKPVVLDSTVILATHDADDPYHDVVRVVIGEWAVRAPLVVPASVVSEVLVGAIRSGPHAFRTLGGFLRDLVDRVEPVDYSVAAVAARYRAQFPKLTLPAALVLATGKTLNAAAILTIESSWCEVDPARVRLIGAPAGGEAP
jgi:predicted nucleic acid-binding protein